MQNLIVIGDTHFGVKNNSMIWLKHQMNGFDEIISYLKESRKTFDTTTIIHVGDLFDSRSSINPIIYKHVSLKLKELNDILGDNKMYIIGGNHDYYYPNETKHNFTGIQMLPKYANIEYITNSFLKHDKYVMIPWFEFHNIDTLKNILKQIQKDDIIFTHTDPLHLDENLYNIIKSYKLVTGHIHTPQVISEYNKIHQVITGASFPIDFRDTNSARGFWNIVDSDLNTLDFHPIKSSIHFFTLDETELVNWQDMGIQDDDYVDVKIKASKINDYEDLIKELGGMCNVSISYIPENISIDESFKEVLNVDTICKKLLPEELKNLYQQMIEACQSN